MDNKKTIGLIIGTLALTGAAVYDNSTFSSSEIARIKGYAGQMNQIETYILTEVLNGRVPQFDVSQTSMDEVSAAYIKVAKKLGDNLDKGEDHNLYSRIRTEAKKHQ